MADGNSSRVTGRLLMAAIMIVAALCLGVAVWAHFESPETQVRSVQGNYDVKQPNRQSPTVTP